MIKLVRVDHRLLHGQVIFSWTKQVGTNYIIVADDKVPNDPISMMRSASRSRWTVSLVSFRFHSFGSWWMRMPARIS